MASTDTVTVTSFQLEQLKDKEKKAEELQKFKYAVDRVVDVLYGSIVWSWGILGVGVPVLIYFKPLPQESIVQAIVVAGIFWVLFAAAHGMKAIGTLEK